MALPSNASKTGTISNKGRGQHRPAEDNTGGDAGAIAEVADHAQPCGQKHLSAAQEPQLVPIEQHDSQAQGTGDQEPYDHQVIDRVGAGDVGRNEIQSPAQRRDDCEGQSGVEVRVGLYHQAYAPIHRPLQRVPEPSIKSRAGIAFLSTVVGHGYLTRMEHHREPIAAPSQLPN